MSRPQDSLLGTQALGKGAMTRNLAEQVQPFAPSPPGTCEFDLQSHRPIGAGEGLALGPARTARSVTRFLMVRHGATEWNVARKYSG